VTETGELDVGVVLNVFREAAFEDAGLETDWDGVGVAIQDRTSAAGLGGVLLREASPVTGVPFVPMVLSRLFRRPKSAGDTMVGERWEASPAVAGKAWRRLFGEVAKAEAMNDNSDCGDAPLCVLWDASLRSTGGLHEAGVPMTPPRDAQELVAGVAMGVRSEASLGSAIVDGRARCFGQEPKIAEAVACGLGGELGAGGTCLF